MVLPNEMLLTLVSSVLVNNGWPRSVHTVPGTHHQVRRGGEEGGGRGRGLLHHPT